MNRLQKKCVIASTGLHLLLVLILFIGPAFLMPKSKFNDASTLEFVPTTLIDAAFSGGGNANARPPAPKPVQPQTASVPTPAPPQPEPAKPTPKVVATQDPEPESLEPAKERKPRTPDVSTTLVTRKTTKPKDTANSEARAQERQLADARQRMARQILGAASSLKDGASDSTAIDTSDFGPGGGGPSYASYASWVRSVYQNAWVAPQDASMDDAVTKVSVTISRDGTVVSSRIIARSGDSQVDASVQRALDRVTTVGRPFPEGAKDSERTYIIPFNLKAKRGIA